MYMITWEYQVKADCVEEFEEIYSATGAWAKLFQKSPGYLRTELLVDAAHPRRYLTIDRWRSSRDYELFLAKWKREYEELDAQCKGLTELETRLGKWEFIPPEPR